MAIRKDYTVDVLRMLDTLKEQIEDVGSVGPLAWGFRKEDYTIQIEKIRASMPKEVKEAANVSKESERILEQSRQEASALEEEAKTKATRLVDDAKAEVQRMLEQARLKQESMVADHEVLKIAKAQSEEIRRAADHESREFRRQIDDYAMDVTMRLEKEVGKVLGSLERTRNQLEQMSPDALPERDRVQQG